jgi:hypothetical protein
MFENRKMCHFITGLVPFQKKIEIGKSLVWSFSLRISLVKPASEIFYLVN